MCMLVHRNIKELPAFNKAVITIGAFDGVHYGHRQIIHQLKEEAAKCGGESVIVTFEPHPRQILAPESKAPKMLTTLEEKIYLLNEQQIDHLVIVPFTRTFSEVPASTYVSDFLVHKFCPHIIITGYDHHFGHNREGDIHLLRHMEEQYDFHVVEIPPQVLHDITVSSTKIRENIESGEVRLANELLGYHYFVSGEVTGGDKRGREMGFPTANIRLHDLNKLIPAEGVYASKVTIPSPVSSDDKNIAKIFNGAANIGRLPTFGGKELRIEVNIFDFEENIYGKEIQLSFYDFIRPDKKFMNVQALQQAMQEDVRKIKERLQYKGKI